jgi:hypothetical protein
MDPEQIQQQMRATRALIDVKLDRLARRTAAMRRRSVRALAVVVCGVLATLAAMRWHRRRKSLNAALTPRLRRVV